MRPAWSLLAVAVALTLPALGACGRKGPLEAPPGAVTQRSGTEPRAPVSQRRDLLGGADAIIDSNGGGGP